MKKRTKSPLQQQVDKRFLQQITGLDLETEPKPKNWFQKIIVKFRKLF